MTKLPQGFINNKIHLLVVQWNWQGNIKLQINLIENGQFYSCAIYDSLLSSSVEGELF